jgi:pilus assembly protein Flp/PilA
MVLNVSAASFQLSAPCKDSIMRNFIHKVAEFLRDEQGVTSIEYGLLASAVAVAAIASLSALGGTIKTAFTTAAASIGS